MESPRALNIVGIVFVAIVIGAAAGWAGSTVFHPAAPAATQARFTTAKATLGSVGSSLSLNAIAEWTTTPVARNGAVGTVTKIYLKHPGALHAGSKIYAVDLRPVVVLPGVVPAFRGLALGDHGADVKQLQDFLVNQHLLSGVARGTFDYVTGQAVNNWQKSLGIDPTGSVQMGDVIYVPTLSQRLTLDPKVVEVGASLMGGEQTVLSLPASPDFTISTTPDLASAIPLQSDVTISAPSGAQWSAAIGPQSTDQQGNVNVVLRPKSGDTICPPDQCTQIPATGQTSLSAKIILSATVRGVVIPSGALRTPSNGALEVVEADGRIRRVKDLADANGLSVVSGIPAGTVVRVPATS
ncbi:peptidoglycan-binding domain-containing protein [Galbitalea soli]|uniref:Peptidoglycan-binding protein n=1 Tax=Galbitalea soli TaxID=1268042 RepID=A0A7C9PNF9_9MICO|nr:peptidoglycan-binding domain-containing protein [Galbitalea soli]NEM91388.1 peptidoglycan-binding protein [Galbitalea soli]NYJ30079.1 peptidoglycan hydrolase-like protein with peptidoglycan-binding domain [Galbitalea soli]